MWCVFWCWRDWLWHLAEEPLTASSCRCGVVDVDIVVLSTHRLLYERLLENLPIHLHMVLSLHQITFYKNITQHHKEPMKSFALQTGYLGKTCFERPNAHGQVLTDRLTGKLEALPPLTWLFICIVLFLPRIHTSGSKRSSNEHCFIKTQGKQAARKWNHKALIWLNSTEKHMHKFSQLIL